MPKKTILANSKEVWSGLNNPDLTVDEADVIVFNIAFDEAISNDRKGAKEAGEEIRKYSTGTAPYTEKFESMKALKILDEGCFFGPSQEEIFEEVEDYVEKLVKKDKFFTMIGGDHSTTIPVLRGIDKAVDKDFGIIHFDAHFDLCYDFEGNKLSHACTERRALELDNISSTDNIYFFAIRSIEDDEYDFMQNNKVNVINAYKCNELGAKKVARQIINHMKKFSKVYLTLDIDGLDPAFASGTGTPQFGGLSSRELLTILEMFFEELNIMAFDLVEVSPPFDNDYTARYAARKILNECWGYQLKKIK